MFNFMTCLRDPANGSEKLSIAADPRIPLLSTSWPRGLHMPNGAQLIQALARALPGRLTPSTRLRFNEDYVVS